MKFIDTLVAILLALLFVVQQIKAQDFDGDDDVVDDDDDEFDAISTF